MNTQRLHSSIPALTDDLTASQMQALLDRFSGTPGFLATLKKFRKDNHLPLDPQD